jgi:uncharacterized protein
MELSSWVSIYWLAPLLGWFSAHVIKFVIKFAESGGKKTSPDVFFESGGMPSSHSAVMVSTLVVIAAQQGINSAIFGLAAAVTAIILYDALNVRRSVGEQGEALLQLVRHAKLTQSFRLSRGHTGLEVIAGSALGVLVAVVLLQIL